MMNIYVIGCGGIGGFVIDKLPMVISSLSLDLATDTLRGGYDTHMLSRAGQVPQVSAVDRLILIDGDTFTPKNAIRQMAGAGSKVARRVADVSNYVRKLVSAAGSVSTSLDVLKEVEAKLATLDSEEVKKAVDNLLGSNGEDIGVIMERIQRSMLKASFLQRMHLVGYNAYVNPGNIDKMIPVVPPQNLENSASASMWNLASTEMRERLRASVVFLCVDNMKTRYEVSKHMEKFENCLVLNGGNSKTAGHVTVYERSEGSELDPPIYKIFGNVQPDVDKRPDEMGCEDVAPEHDQIAVTNSMIADIMLARFVQWAREGLYKTVRDSNVRYNEIVMDITTPSLVPLYHRFETEEKEKRTCQL